VAVLTCAGCGGSAPELGRSSARILGGVLDRESEAVVAVVNFAGGQCSGSLIAPRLVLTARHCVADTAGRTPEVVCGRSEFEDPDSAGAVFVVALPEITDDPSDYRAVSAIRMPEGVGDDLCGTDAALLVLEDAVESITPLLPRLDREAQPGERYSAIGYGNDEADPDIASGVRKRLDGLEVACVGLSCRDDVRDNEWVGSGGPCKGDSGGPALDAEGQVIGIVSRGRDGCREPVFGSVAARASWLTAEVKAEAFRAGEPPPRWAPCSKTEECITEENGSGEARLDSSCAFARQRSTAPVFVALALLMFCVRRGEARVKLAACAAAERA
jgi:hypothetical protein